MRFNFFLNANWVEGHIALIDLISLHGTNEADSSEWLIAMEKRWTSDCKSSDSSGEMTAFECCD